MKKFLKILLIIILVIVLITVLIVGGVLIAISSSEDNFDASKIDKNLTKQTLIANELNEDLDHMKDDYKLDLTFTEEDLNSLIYCFVKEDVNENYDPVDGETDEEIYILNTKVGNRNVNVKHAYATIDGDEVTMTVTASAFGFIKTRVFLTFTVETDDDNYTLIIKKGKLGKLNIFSKLALNIVKKATLDKTLNDFLNDQNIPFVFDVDKLVFTSSKADFSAWINDLLSSDEEDSSTLMASTLIDVLLSPENDFVTFGMIDENEFGVDINLEVLRVDESKVTLDPRIKEPFDKDSLIKNLSQTIAINMLNGDGLYATFTELDINKLIYSSTDGYSSFASSSEIMEGVYFDFSIDGIIFDIKENGDAITLNIILNINGLLTLATYSGTTNQVSDTMIVIKMEDYLYLGNDLAVDSSFIGALLEENLNDSTFLSYDRSANAFTLSSSIFDDYLNEGSIAHNFHVNGINFITDALNVTLVSLNPITNLTISNASNLIKEALKVDFLDLSEFSDETEAISNVIDELESIKEQLNDPNFNESDLDTSSLVSAINELTTEEQETFFNQLQAQAGSDAINDLYNELFGGLS